MAEVTRLVLVRHGEADCNVAKRFGGPAGCTGLSDKGRWQVEQLRDRLRRTGELADTSALEVGARRLAGQMAACLQGALLVRFAPAAVADAFCATRLGTEYGGTLGTLPRGVDLAAVVTRTTPVVTG